MGKTMILSVTSYNVAHVIKTAILAHSTKNFSSYLTVMTFIVKALFRHNY